MYLRNEDIEKRNAIALIANENDLCLIAYDHDVSNKPFEMQFASFMSVGYGIKFNSTAMRTGLKGYFAFNNNYVNKFGVGLTVKGKI